MSNDPLITRRYIAERSRPDTFNEVRTATEALDDPVERRLRLMEAAIADMAYKLRYANESYEFVFKRIQKMEAILLEWSKSFLSDEDRNLIIDFIKELRS